jgi:hypothetical protein
MDRGEALPGIVARAWWPDGSEYVPDAQADAAEEADEPDDGPDGGESTDGEESTDDGTSSSPVDPAGSAET